MFTRYATVSLVGRLNAKESYNLIFFLLHFLVIMNINHEEPMILLNF